MNATDTTAEYILSAALEGGIGYWSLATEIVYDEAAKDITYLGVTLHEVEEDESKHNENDSIVQQTIFGNNYWQLEGHTITLADVTKAIRTLAFEEVEYAGGYIKSVCRALIFDSIDEVDYDAGDADQIVQVAALGKIVYG